MVGIKGYYLLNPIYLVGIERWEYRCRMAERRRTNEQETLRGEKLEI